MGSVDDLNTRTQASWDDDLAFGKRPEGALAEVLRYATCEPKSDRLAEQTSNHFIEYTHDGQPVGILHTAADYWVSRHDAARPRPSLPMRRAC